jgi:hypothetical protein
MKTIFTLLLFLLSQINYAQGYGVVGTSMTVEHKYVNNSITIGAGYKINNISAGIIADFYGVDKSKLKVLIAAFDIKRIYLTGNLHPYISIRPGRTLYENQETKTEGRWAFGSSAGVQFKPKEFGFDLSFGWQYTSYTVMKTMVKSNAFRISLCLLM